MVLLAFPVRKYFSEKEIIEDIVVTQYLIIQLPRQYCKK